MDIRCNGCKKTPDEISEYVQFSKYEEMTPTEYVIQEEGTFNPENGHFCCTSCYIKMGQPSSPWGWKAP